MTPLTPTQQETRVNEPQPPPDWYHDQNVITVTGWQRFKRWVHDRHIALWWWLFGRLP